MPTPRASNPDSTIPLLRDPYRFISRQCQRLGTDAFETRLLLQRTICMTGPDAARLFYDHDKFQRAGAMPGAIRDTLLGRGGVQGLDGHAHLHRKGMLMTLMTPERLAHLVRTTGGEWDAAAARWATMPRIVLFDEACEVLTRAIGAWAGVPLPEHEVALRTRQLRLLFDGAGAIGPRHLSARLARIRANRWAARIIERIRSGALEPPHESAAHILAHHRDPAGNRLDPRIAAVDLLNILRPTVAIAVYVTFLAHALHEHPDARAALNADEGDADHASEDFVHEVRRHYPFFPAVAARVRRPFTWRGHDFPAGRRVLLDLHGTNHDPRTWDDPHTFRPDRFRAHHPDAFTLIPQGGGDHFTSHRCAGEWTTIALMKDALHFLTHRLTYRLPDQDLRLDLSRLPALPRSQCILAEVTPVPSARTRSRGPAGHPAHAKSE